MLHTQRIHLHEMSAETPCNAVRGDQGVMENNQRNILQKKLERNAVFFSPHQIKHASYSTEFTFTGCLQRDDQRQIQVIKVSSKNDQIQCPAVDIRMVPKVKLERKMSFCHLTQ